MNMSIERIFQVGVDIAGSQVRAFDPGLQSFEPTAEGIDFFGVGPVFYPGNSYREGKGSGRIKVVVYIKFRTRHQPVANGNETAVFIGKHPSRFRADVRGQAGRVCPDIGEGLNRQS